MLAIIPARGGSRGIPRKNLKDLNGHPLIYYTIIAAQKSRYIDQLILSTDDPEIAGVASQYGVEIPFMRPEDLATDTSRAIDTYIYTVERLNREHGTACREFVVLQPTSPFRLPRHVEQTVEHLIEGRYDAVWTVSKTDSKAHPLKQLVIQGDRLDYYDPAGAAIIARQQLTPVYHRNGVAYAITRQCIDEQRTIKGERTSYVIINDPLINIDTMDDLLFAEFLLGRGVPGMDELFDKAGTRDDNRRG